MPRDAYESAPSLSSDESGVLQCALELSNDDVIGRFHVRSFAKRDDEPVTATDVV